MSSKHQKKPHDVMDEETALHPRVPVDPSALSRAARMPFIPDFYEDRPFTCVGCGAACVFTALQQKYQFEVWKDYYWTCRSRCDACQAEWRAMSQEIDGFPQRLRDGVSPEEAAFMLERLDRFRVLNNGTYDVALRARIKNVRDLARR